MQFSAEYQICDGTTITVEDGVNGEFSQVATGYEIANLADFGVDPNSPTSARPGSKTKVNMLAARYLAGLPLWNASDGDEEETETPIRRAVELSSSFSDEFDKSVEVDSLAFA
jgi:hypothetical protein